MSLRVKYKNFTEFSNYRFMIPQICGHEGRAIFLDSDTICLGDISELFRAPMSPEGAILAKPEAYQGTGGWGLSVALFDCSLSRFDLDAIFEEIEKGLYTYTDLHQLSSAFLKVHPFVVEALDVNWNVFDQYDQHTKLIHFTNLLRQPWKFPNHPSGDLWFKYFNEAREAGAITKQDIETTKMRAYCRQDILKGNNPRPAGKNLRTVASALLRKVTGRA